jgi:hypothetical protein
MRKAPGTACTPGLFYGSVRETAGRGCTGAHGSPWKGTFGSDTAPPLTLQIQVGAQAAQPAGTIAVA